MPNLKVKDSSGNWVSAPYIIGGTGGAGGAVNKVNGKAPDSSGNVTLTAEDVGARPNSWTPSATDVNAIPASLRGAANGVASLDSKSQIPLAQLPPQAKNGLVVANIAARDAIATKFDGLSVYVKDATGDSTVSSGGAYYLYTDNAWIKISGQSAGGGSSASTDWNDIQNKPQITNSFNGRTGAVVPTSGDYTADMVGARSNTWMPSATDVKAIPSSQKGAANGVAELDASSHVPLAQLPDEVKNSKLVANIAARDAISNKFDGLIVYVEDASSDATVEAGPACYMYNGSAWRKLPGAASSGTSVTSWSDIQDKPAIANSFNGRSGNVVPAQGDYTAEMVGARPKTWTPSASEVGAIPSNQKGVANGVASLDASSHVPLAQLPDEVKNASGAAAAVQTALTTHEGSNKHITDAERTAWNAKASASKTVAVTLTAAGWSGEAAPFTQTVNVTGLKATGRGSNGTIGLAQGATAEMRTAARVALISVTGQADGVLTVAADGEKPIVDIAASVLVLD